MTREEFARLTESGLLLLDGGMGSSLRKAGMPVGVCTELWAQEHPEIVIELQSAYVDAGSRIVYAPSFMANREGLSMYGLADRLEEINRGAVALTRKAVGDRAYVAGDVTTTGKVLEPKGPMRYNTLFGIYQEQIRCLADAGADLIAIETMLTLDETTVALEAARSVCDLPVLCTMTIMSDGELYYGGSVYEAVETLQELGADAVGVNCSVGPDQLESVVSGMKAVAKVPLVVKPNAGMPEIDAQGTAHYSMQPEAFANAMRKLAWRGANLIGGCCGTTPEYIRLLKERVLD